MLKFYILIFLKPYFFAGLIGTTPRKKKAQQRQQSRCAFATQVEKINLKWDVIAKQQELDLASAQEAAATAAADGFLELPGSSTSSPKMKRLYLII